MPAKLYYFPRNPKYREELAAMPAEKRRKLLHLGNLRWRLLHSRLKRILARRAEQKKGK